MRPESDILYGRLRECHNKITKPIQSIFTFPQKHDRFLYAHSRSIIRFPYLGGVQDEHEYHVVLINDCNGRHIT